MNNKSDMKYAPDTPQVFGYTRTAFYGQPAKAAADKLDSENKPRSKRAKLKRERARQKLDRVPRSKQTKRNAKFWAAVQELLETGQMTLDEAKAQVKITN